MSTTPAPAAGAAAAGADLSGHFEAFDQLATMVALAAPDGNCLQANSALENTVGVSRRALALRDVCCDQ